MHNSAQQNVGGYFEIKVMSFKKKGQLSKSPERLKHLGDFLSRLFWKRERKSRKGIN